MPDNKNPYEKPDGTPKEGMFVEYFKWEREKELERISKLPPEEQKRIREAEKALAERMNS